MKRKYFVMFSLILSFTTFNYLYPASGNQNNNRWGFGLSGTMHFYPLSGGATINVKTPTRIPIIFGIDLYGRSGAFYLGGILDVWLLNVSMGTRGRFYFGLGVTGGYTFTENEYYDAGVRIPVGIAFALDKTSRSEFYIDFTPALMYRDAFSSDRERYFTWSPSLGVRIHL